MALDFVTSQTYLADILHDISQGLLAPDVILLIAFIAYAVFCIGSVVVEGLTERRNFREATPRLLSDLMSCGFDDIPDVIERSGLLNRQKVALLVAYDYRTLTGDALLALARKLVAREQMRYDRIVGRNEMGVKAAPMLGLMGTLIPLGPGIAALGTGNLQALSSSIIVAFDTTVAGLATAVVCLVIVKVRRAWYEAYLTEFDSAMATLLQRLREARAQGEEFPAEPGNRAEEFARALRPRDRGSVGGVRAVAETYGDGALAGEGGPSLLSGSASTAAGSSSADSHPSFASGVDAVQNRTEA